MDETNTIGYSVLSTYIVDLLRPNGRGELEENNVRDRHGECFVSLDSTSS